jgi:DNA polymerase
MTPNEIADNIRMFYGPPMGVLSDCLRSFIRAAPGKKLIVADYSNIEGRGLAWLAGEESKLDAFRAFDRKEGPDLYLVTAAAIYGVPVSTLNKESPERQPGKTCELAFGYQGGVGAYRKMESGAVGAATFSDVEVDAFKKKWRAKYPKITQYWYDLEDAAVAAVRRPGSITEAGAPARQVKFRKSGSFLWAQLPSKRCLCYPYPELRVQWFARSPGKPALIEEAEEVILGTAPPVREIRKIKASEKREYEDAGWETWQKDQLTFMGVNSLTKQWERQSTYGGSLCENLTQAICRDVLAEAMKRLDKAEYDIAFTVHDEIVCEVPEGFGSLVEMEQIMCELPVWAKGFPITAEGYSAKRYRK